jgi:hypothetical protein
VPLGNIRSIALLVLGPVRSITSNWSLTHRASAAAKLAGTTVSRHSAKNLDLEVISQGLVRNPATIIDGDG